MMIQVPNASVAYRPQRHARPAVEEEVAADHGEAAAAPDHAAKVIFNLLRRAGCDGDPDIVALPDFLPRPKRWRLQRGIAVIGPRHASGEDHGEYKCERFHLHIRLRRWCAPGSGKVVPTPSGLRAPHELYRHMQRSGVSRLKLLGRHRSKAETAGRL